MCFTYVSPSVEKLRGYTAEEKTGRWVDDALKPEESTAMRELIRQRAEAFKNGSELPEKVYVNEVDQPCKDGSIVMTEVTSSYQLNPVTGHVETLGVTRNITERKKMEIALQEENKLMEAIFKQRPGVLYLYDSEGHLLRWNKKHEEMTGIPPKSWITFTCWTGTKISRKILTGYQRCGKSPEGRFRIS
jgi:PAS domain S-box-containing protein